MRTLFFLLSWLAVPALFCATHSGQYHPATEAAVHMMAPAPLIAMADTAELVTLSDRVLNRSKIGFVTFISSSAFSLLLLLVGLTPALSFLLFWFALILGVAAVWNLVTSGIALNRLDIALEDASPGQRVRFLNKVLITRIVLKVLGFLVGLGALRAMLETL